MIPFVKFYNTPRRENKALSMSSTGYGIHIHELSRLCHITVVWASNQEVTRHQDTVMNIIGPSSYRTQVTEVKPGLFNWNWD
jgi:hypothetical protein